MTAHPTLHDFTLHDFNGLLLTMKPLRTSLLVLLLGLSLLPAVPVRAQAPPPEKSPRRAFALSLLVPGLGHRYVHDGSWRGAATIFGLADAGLWLGLVGTQWHHDQLQQSYRTLAASRAEAQTAGKDRAFFLNLARYPSSEAFREAQLRTRAWEQIDYVADRSYQWSWQTEADFQRYRVLREDAEALRRRRPILLALLAGNRLLASLSALRAANRADDGGDLSLSLAPAPAGAAMPLLRLQAQW